MTHGKVPVNKNKKSLWFGRATVDNLYDLTTYKINEEERNLIDTFEALRELGNASTNQIINFISNLTEEHNKKVAQDAQDKFESDILHSPIERDDYVKQGSKVAIHIRTVQRLLKKLIEQRLVEKHNNTYSLTGMALSDIRNFPQGFGEAALRHIGLFPIKSVDQSLDDFIVRFGAYIVFTFIEAARPVINRAADKKHMLEKWLDYAIPTYEMFNLFLNLYQETQTSKEVNQKTIEKLMDSFEKIYPDIYIQLTKAREIIIHQPKSRQINANKYYVGGTGWAYVVPKDWHKQLGLHDHDNVR